LGSFSLRILVVAALLLVLPFGGTRVICIAAAEDTAGPAAPVARVEPEREMTECERLCPLHDPDMSSSEGERCALSAGASSLMASAGIAVMRPLVPPPMPTAVRTVYAETLRFMPDPDLPQFARPPKSPTA
jgi:hypothetical protein